MITIYRCRGAGRTIPHFFRKGSQDCPSPFSAKWPGSFLQGVSMFEKLPAWLVRIVVSPWRIAWSWLGNKINALIINQSVNSARHRPHPWSTVHDYVSWTSLTDLTLERAPSPGLPTRGPARFEGLLRRCSHGPADQEQRYCEKSTLLFPAFAQYLTDSFIRTRMPNASTKSPRACVAKTRQITRSTCARSTAVRRRRSSPCAGGASSRRTRPVEIADHCGRRIR